MTKAHYVIYLLLTISWSKDLDEVAKQNTIIEDKNPQKEDNSNGIKTNCKIEQETECQHSSKNLLLNILSSKSGIKNFETSECRQIVNNDDPCPPGFKIHIADDDTYCYELKLNQKFGTPCKYLHSIPFIKLPKCFQGISINNEIWINIFRNESSRYPEFLHLKNGATYGKPLNRIDINESNLNSSCIVISKNKFKRVSCSDRFGTLCVYSYKTLQSNKLIATCNSSSYTNCMVSDFYASKPTCFCKKVISAFKPKKEQFCTKLAEPIYPYQNEFLKTFLHKDENVCWMGMYKQQNSNLESYHWMSTNETVNYTDWSQPYSCENSEGAFKFDDISYGRWTLRKDRTLNCALCEVAVDLKKPSLTLTFNVFTSRVELTVKNYHSVSGEDSEDIYCFSDSNDIEFTHQVSYKTIYNFGTTKIAYLLSITKSPSRYWCHAFELSSENVIKSNIIVARNYYESVDHNEFVITAKFNVSKYSLDKDPFVEKRHVDICANLRVTIYIELENCIHLESLRPVGGRYGDNYKHIYVNCHLTTLSPTRTRQQQYDKINEILLRLEESTCKFTIENFGTYDICLRSTTLTPDNQTLIWPSTVIGASAVPMNVLCLDKNRGMLPVTRKCIGNSLDGAKWDEPVGTCYNDTEYSETTHELFNLAYGNVSTQEITQSLLKLTEDSISDEPTDVHLATSALERVSVTEDKKINKNDFSVIINNMMNYDDKTLKVAQSVLNSTDRLLFLLDNFMVNHIDRPWVKILPRLVIHISDLRKSDILGLAMYNTLNKKNFETYKIVQLYRNTSFENLTKDEQLDTAVLFPSQEVNKIKEKFDNDTPIMLVIAVFYDDILFQETNNKSVQQSQSKIVGVIVPGYKTLENPIKIALRTREKFENKKECSFWDYGLNDEMVSTHGQWETSAESETKLLEICEFYHMTHFGLLIKGDLIRTPHDLALNIITALGSALSLIGIIPIFLTAIMFKSWRNKAGNVILINFCIAITIQIALMFSLYAITGDGIACKAIAASLHYTVVSEFCWMFVVAMLQYRRFVMVFTPQESNIVLKCIISGWIVPLLPVVVTLSASMQSYSLNAHNFCYISGKYLIYAYICPILFILVCNAVVFITIIYSVSRQTAACVQKHRSYKLQILLALFLFFVLGMTWLFGFLGALIDALWLTYIFCITATLRGIVLFLFFIAGNEETSLLWKKKITYQVDSNTRKSSKPTTSDTILTTD